MTKKKCRIEWYRSRHYPKEYSRTSRHYHHLWRFQSASENPIYIYMYTEKHSQSYWQCINQVLNKDIIGVDTTDIGRSLSTQICCAGPNPSMWGSCDSTKLGSTSWEPACRPFKGPGQEHAGHTWGWNKEGQGVLSSIGSATGFLCQCRFIIVWRIHHRCNIIML